MSRRTTALAAALSLLPLGQPLLLGSTTALATAAVVLSPQAAHAQSAGDYVNAGVEKGKSGDFQGAIADFTRAIEINPQNASAYNNRGYAKYFQGDFKGALVDVNKALAITPNDGEIFYTRGLVKHALGQDRSACEDLKRALSLGIEGTSKYLQSEEGAWCRNMR